MLGRMSKPAVIPDKKPCSREGSTFVPKAMNISWKHPENGPVTMCVEENDMNTNIMYWYTCQVSMWSTDERDITTRLKNIIKEHPEATVETNHKKWKEIADVR